MKAIVQRTGVVYKEQSGALSSATLDRAENAITYRVFGCEQQRKQAYEENLTAYEKAAVSANIWNTMMPPLYKVISMTGVLFILYFGAANVLGTGWKVWTAAILQHFYPVLQSCPSNPPMRQNYLMPCIRHRFHGSVLSR